MKTTYLIAGALLLTTAPGLADPPAGGSRSAPSVCDQMPSRQGHYWAERDWCRWLEEFINNREARDKTTAGKG